MSRSLFGEISRGSNKIYIHLLADGELWVTNETLEGAPLPAAVVQAPVDPPNVLVIPVLSVSQKVMLHTATEQETLFLTPGKAATTGRRNTLLRNATALAIRNADDAGSGIPWRSILVQMDRAISTLDGATIVHGSVVFEGVGAVGVAGGVAVRALASDGAPLGQPAQIMGGYAKESPRYVGELIRTVNFSLTLPAGCVPAVIWAHVQQDADDAHQCSPTNTPLQDGMLCLRPDQFQQTLADWKAYTCAADADPRYHDWFCSHRANERELERQRAWCAQGVEEPRPVFSIVVPLYETPLEFFRQMVASVQAQSYPRWELVLVNANARDGELAHAVEAYAAQDARIRELRLKENEGITGNTNRGIETATGDFVAFLDQDDVLESDALYHYAQAVQDYPTIDLIYCDEDKLQGDRYSAPFFKPDWNPDLQCAMNYVCHLLAIRRSVLDEVALPTADYEGAQDHYLSLMAARKARHVHHVPRVLYHWRIHEGSTAQSAGEKAYTTAAGVRAVQAYLDACGYRATAHENPAQPNRCLVSWRPPEPAPLVSIIIPNKDMPEVLDRCLQSLFGLTAYPAYEVIVVENNSVLPETFDYYDAIQREHVNMHVVDASGEGGFNFARLVNAGATAAAGEYLLLLNNDTQVTTPGWLTQMVGLAAREDVGAVGAKLLFPDGTLQHAGVAFRRDIGPEHLGRYLPGGTSEYYNLYNSAQDLLCVTAACLMTPRALFEQLGGLDEQNLPVDFNDVDYCLRVVDQGLRVVYDPSVVLYHHESLSRGTYDSEEKVIAYREAVGFMTRRWARYYVQGDPYTSPVFRRDCIYRGLGDE